MHLKSIHSPKQIKKKDYFQDNNFDFPDRLFNSFEATWRLASSESTTDFKELLAELFCLPECLLNKDELDMGIRQVKFETLV